MKKHAFKGSITLIFLGPWFIQYTWIMKQEEQEDYGMNISKAIFGKLFDEENYDNIENIYFESFSSCKYVDLIIPIIVIQVKIYQGLVVKIRCLMRCL